MNLISGVNFLLKTQVKDRKVVVQKANPPKGKRLAFPVDFWMLVTQMVKKSFYKAEDPDLVLGSGSPPGEGNGNPLQYSCLGNAMDRDMWRVIVHGVAKSWKWLSD